MFSDVSVADPHSRMMKHFVRLMGTTDRVLLPIHKGMTTDTMIQFLRNPEAFQRQQPILGIFPVRDADVDFLKHMNKPWHTSAAVAAVETGAPIVPFLIEGLPYDWGPMDTLKRSLARCGKCFRIQDPSRAARLAEGIKEERIYKDITERVRQAVRILARGIQAQAEAWP